jgi:hypothetical protein
MKQNSIYDSKTISQTKYAKFLPSPYKSKLFNYFSAVFKNTVESKHRYSTNNDLEIEDIRKKIKVSENMRDFDYFLRKFNEIELIKNVIFNEYQNLSLDYLKKPSQIFDNSSLNESYSNCLIGKEEKLEILTNYFAQNIAEKPLSGNDEYIFNRLEDKIKVRILEKISRKDTK